jgi:uncharacterized protein
MQKNIARDLSSPQTTTEPLGCSDQCEKATDCSYLPTSCCRVFASYRVTTAIALILVSIIIALIRAYQLLISPMLPPACRFYPTCSHYSVEALRRYGLLQGGYQSLRRLLRCHPFHPGGYDPVK